MNTDFDQKTKKILHSIIECLAETVISNLDLEFAFLPNCPDPKMKNQIHLKIGRYDNEKHQLIDKTKNYTEFTIFIFSSFEENLLFAEKTLKDLREYNYTRYDKLRPYQSCDERTVIFAFLHEIGHCVYMNQIQKEQSKCPEDTVEGYCNKCLYKFQLDIMNCNYVHECAADQFAIDHLDEIMENMINSD